MKFNPKVSIIIPVYNGSNYLKEAIDSALAQTYKNIEIIVVNDGSRDNGATEKIVKSYGDRIRYYKKDNGGVATALNLGIEKMTGEYFSWLSHDDMYANQKIELQLNFLMKGKSEKTIVACNAKTLFDSGIKKRTKINKHAFKYIDIFLSSSAVVGLNGCSLLIPKRAFTEVGIFDDSLKFTQDYDLWFRMQKKYNFELLDEPLVISRVHFDQESILNRRQMTNDGDELHYKFIRTIPYSRFEDFFKDNKQNIEHTYGNYKVYKARSYKKNSEAILKIILQFYYENNKHKFYNIYYNELVLDNFSKPLNKKQIKELQSSIDREYQELINSKNITLPIKYPLQVPEVKRHKARRLADSLQQDGIYLSGEKAARKLYARLKKNNKH